MFILGLLLCLTGCKSPSPLPQDPIKIAFIKDPSTYDPKRACDLASTSLCFMLYEGLFRSSEKGGLEYGVCENVQVSQNKKTYIFKLKKTYWSDGSPVTAYDFENTWIEQLHPDFPSPYCYLFYPIKNAHNYKKGLALKHDVGIKAIAHDLLKIDLESQRDDIFEILSFSCFHPFKKIQDVALFNGPYKLIKHKCHELIELEKNKYYHDANKVDISHLNIRILDSESTAFAMYQKGELDIVGGPLSGVPQEELLKHAPHHIQNMAGSTVCAFNMQSKLFSNKNLRKAFAYAIDHNTLNKLTTVKPFSSSFLPSLSPARERVSSYNSKQDLARRYLRLALNELNIDKKELNSLCYYFGAKPEHAKIAQLLHLFWKTVLDVDVKLAKIEHKTLAAKISNKDFDFAQLVWLCSYDSPLALLDRFKDAKLSKNFSSFQHPELSILIKRLEHGFQNKDHILKQIEDIFEEHIPFVPVNDWQYSYFVSSKIDKLCFTNLGTLNFTFIKINKDACSLPPSSGI